MLERVVRSIATSTTAEHRPRVSAAFEHFHDLRPLGHEALAQRIAADGIG